MPTSYVTYDSDGSLTGAFLQVVLPEHSANHIVVSDDVRRNWVMYQANVTRDGVEVSTPEPAAVDLNVVKAAKNEQINQWRAAANMSSFQHKGKAIACDSLSRSDIDGVANSIGLSGGFPAGFPMAWKAIDNTYLMLPDVDAFKELYASMTAKGSANFKHAQELKAKVAVATTAEEIEAIVW